MLRVIPLVLVVVVSAPALAQAHAGLPPRDLVAFIREGGYIIFIRHAQTERDYADQVDAVMGDCSTQRTLSEAGWRRAILIGSAFDRLGIPVGDVISSEYCRSWQTAALAFGRYQTNSNLNFEPAEDYTPVQLEAMRSRMSFLLSHNPGAGLNTILIGHDDPFEAATGIYPEPMGVAFVIRPTMAGEFEVLGSIPPDGWNDIDD
nr:histidine phosphatase family protein [Pontivivens ytuae]